MGEYWPATSKVVRPPRTNWTQGPSYCARRRIRYRSWRG